jgi:hypothetical protein
MFSAAILHPPPFTPYFSLLRRDYTSSAVIICQLELPRHITFHDRGKYSRLLFLVFPTTAHYTSAECRLG